MYKHNILVVVTERPIIFLEEDVVKNLLLKNTLVRKIFVLVAAVMIQKYRNFPAYTCVLQKMEVYSFNVYKI